MSHFVLDIVPVSNSTSNNYKMYGADKGLVRIAWAFLRPLGANGHQNTGPQKQRLQLLEVVSPNHISTSLNQNALSFPQEKLLLPTFDKAHDGHGRAGKLISIDAPSLVLDHAGLAANSIEAGGQLMAWWASGSSFRTLYPSTIYVTVKPVGMPKADLMPSNISSFIPNHKS
ncbi:unnamed protein product [Protopolystoma xenopodis]|uniref:Uncharacterized protein n=1 Tax=Protopolystoma xenopodis TaxID=117903 RepID=A0A3S5B4A4_9PLAT|nr:unnamed protein product [Protopolystoma xenopodis]